MVFDMKRICGFAGNYVTSFFVLQSLKLKTGCPVMVVANITEDIVNGLIGHVAELGENSIKVHFPSLNRTCSLSQYDFT